MLNNWLNTSLLMAAIVALFGAVGMTVGGDRSGLFRTHPATEERVRRLLQLARQGL